MPPLHGRRAVNNNNSNTSVIQQPTTPAIPTSLSSSIPLYQGQARVQPTRLAVLYSPPTLALEYIDHDVDILVAQLAQRYPQYLHEALIHRAQLTRLVQMCLNPLPVDLNRADDETLSRAKAAMNGLFEQSRIKPGDAGYVYDKEVEFQAPTETSDWD